MAIFMISAGGKQAGKWENESIYPFVMDETPSMDMDRNSLSHIAPRELSDRFLFEKGGVFTNF